MLEAVPLQGAEVVGVAQLAPERLEDRPVVIGGPGAGLAHEGGVVVALGRVVVEQRIVHVEEEHDVLARHHEPSDLGRAFDAIGHQQ